jgi:hypothetical protein
MAGLLAARRTASWRRWRTYCSTCRRTNRRGAPGATVRVRPATASRAVATDDQMPMTSRLARTETRLLLMAADEGNAMGPVLHVNWDQPWPIGFRMRASPTPPG